MNGTEVTNHVEKPHKGSIGYIVAFCCILLAPSLFQLLGIDLDSELHEKRSLNELPEFKVSSSFPLEFEAYYNDHFGLRNSLVSVGSKIKIGMFNTSPKPDLVLLGANGYMFYNDRNDDVYVSYSHKNSVSENELQASFAKHSKLREEMKAKGITYIMAMWPNKHSVYPEQMPLNMKIQITHHNSLANQLAQFFSENNFPIIDTRERIIQDKRQHQLYHKFDSHWNAYGAFIAYQEFCKQTRTQLALTPFDISEFNIKYTLAASGDLTNMMGIDGMTLQRDSIPVFELKKSHLGYDIIENTGYPERRIVTENNNCGNTTTVVVYRDSYGDGILPYLSLHFKKVIYIKKSNIDLDYIESTNAEIVLNMRVERYLRVFL